MSWLSSIIGDVTGVVTSIPGLAAIPIPGLGTVGDVSGVAAALNAPSGDNKGAVSVGQLGGSNPAMGFTSGGGSSSGGVFAPLTDAANSVNQTIVSTEQQVRTDFVIFGVYVVIVLVILIALYALIAPSTNIDLGDIKDAAALAA